VHGDLHYCLYASSLLVLINLRGYLIFFIRP
jgi:hypothetical protein